jgi:hypothetical protein
MARDRRLIRDNPEETFGQFSPDVPPFRRAILNGQWFGGTADSV